MQSFGDIVAPSFVKQSFSRFMLRELRSDHAGEMGAVYIYKGVLAVTRDSRVRNFAHNHLATEIQHLYFFDQWLPSNQHSKLIALWKLSGFLLGALSALMGKKVLFITIAAVETFVVKHYAQQINYLQTQGSQQEQALLPILEQLQAEEQHHRDDAEGRLMPNGPLAKLWCAVVGCGSALAVTIAKRV